MTNHPITPPDEMMEEWRTDYMGRGHAFIDVAKEIAQWGADQELEACCEWFQEFYKSESWVLRDLKRFRAARRPKPPSLKEQALETLHSMQIEPCMINGVNINADLMAKYDILRRALEALPND